MADEMTRTVQKVYIGGVPAVITGTVDEAYLELAGIRIPFASPLTFDRIDMESGRPVYSGTIEMQAR